MSLNVQKIETVDSLENEPTKEKLQALIFCSKFAYFTVSSSTFSMFVTILKLNMKLHPQYLIMQLEIERYSSTVTAQQKGMFGQTDG